MRARALALVALLARASLAFADLDDASERREIDDYHYVFSADCQPYMTWQARALYESWRAIGSPGRMTRLISCTDDEYARYEHMDVVPDTVKCPSFVWYAKEKFGDDDGYSAYNLPGGMNHWAQNVGTDRKWVVKLDADMLLLKPLSVREIPASKGVAASGQYDYLVGTKNGMAKWFVDEEVEKRLAPVGGWEIFDAEDFVNMTPHWFAQTVKVRMDKRIWFPYRGTGDVYVSEESPRPWISEMYGFVFGCGLAGLTHNVMRSVQLYAGMKPWDEASADPFIVHYGLRMDEGPYSWDKHWEPGHLERMTCATRDVEPFPVVPYPKRPSAHALQQERHNYIKVKIMYITVSAINDAVKKYNDEKCGRGARSHRVETKSLPTIPKGKDVPMKPSREDPKVKPRMTQKPTPVPVMHRAERAGDATERLLARKATLKVEREIAHEERMHRMWTMGSLTWVVGFCVIVYRFVRTKTRQRSEQRRRRETNPFREV